MPNFSEIVKHPHNCQKINLLWVKYHVFCYELYIQAQNGSVVIPMQTCAHIAFTGLAYYVGKLMECICRQEDRDGMR